MQRELEDEPAAQYENRSPGGNDRLGRLPITFLLCVAGAIRDPILYLTLFSR